MQQDLSKNTTSFMKGTLIVFGIISLFSLLSETEKQEQTFKEIRTKAEISRFENRLNGLNKFKNNIPSSSSSSSSSSNLTETNELDLNNYSTQENNYIQTTAVTSIQKPTNSLDMISKAKAFARERRSVWPNHHMSEAYVDILAQYCDDKALRDVLSVGSAETRLGHDPKHILTNNLWGWHLDGNINHDPDVYTMASQICGGFMNAYRNMITADCRVDAGLSMKYTGNDRVPSWTDAAVQYCNQIENI